MPVKLGLNGFGRIGRYLLRLMADEQDMTIAAINARADNAALAYLFNMTPPTARLPAVWITMRTASSSTAGILPSPAARPVNGNGTAWA